jgi:SM-20-related protein
MTGIDVIFFGYTHNSGLMSNNIDDSLIASLAKSGYAIKDDFLLPPTLQSYRELAIAQKAHLHPAATGRGSGAALRPTVRSDRIAWLDPNDSHDSIQALFGRFEQLRRNLNEALLLGLFDLELHWAHYPTGAAYGPHVDRFRDDDARTVSAVLYLNGPWGPDDGGALRLYCGLTTATGYQDIAPIGGRLVLFLSDRFLHEVLPARRDRWSVTGWFRRR